MANRTFVILGPDGSDEIPMHWDREFWQWMETPEGSKPRASSIYSAAELQIPLNQYPTGGEGVFCLETGQMLTLPRGGGDKETETKI